MCACLPMCMCVCVRVCVRLLGSPCEIECASVSVYVGSVAG